MRGDRCEERDWLARETCRVLGEGKRRDEWEKEECTVVAAEKWHVRMRELRGL